MSPHTWASRCAVAATCLLAALQLYWAGVGSARAEVELSDTLLGAASLIAAAALARASCFETRFSVAVIVAAQLAATGLAVLIGLPGGSRQGIDAHALQGLLLPVLVIGLIFVDRQVRRATSAAREVPSPYAL